MRRQVERLAETWGVDLGEPLAGATCSMVLRGTRSGEPVVLKAPVLGEEAESGWRAALAFSGHGGVPILAHDPETGTLLMPLAQPGVTLHQLLGDSHEANAACAQLMLRLRQAAPLPGLLTADQWFGDLFASQHEPAKAVARDLIESTESVVPVHADLHHDNILLHGDEWLAIDPKGVLADPAADVGAFMHNPVPELYGVGDLDSAFVERLETFAEWTGDPLPRLWAWAFVMVTNSALWDGESSDAWSAALSLERVGQRTGWLAAFTTRGK